MRRPMRKRDIAQDLGEETGTKGWVHFPILDIRADDPKMERADPALLEALELVKPKRGVVVGSATKTSCKKRVGKLTL